MVGRREETRRCEYTVDRCSDKPRIAGMPKIPVIHGVSTSENACYPFRHQILCVFRRYPPPVVPERYRGKQDVTIKQRDSGESVLIELVKKPI